MRNKILQTLIIFLLLILSQKSEAQSDSQSKDIPEAKQKKYVWGGIPVLSYDSDLGLRYGAVINLFDFSDPTILPDYLQRVRLRLYNSTKGTSNFSLLYDSESLIPRSNFTFEASYVEDISLDFYGFNGSNAAYFPEYSDAGQDAYINKYFYNYHRKLIRVRGNMQNYLGSRQFRLFTGLEFNRYILDDIDYERFDIPAGMQGTSPEQTTLYKKYSDWGAIPINEQSGGDLLTLTAGLIYDSRLGKIHCKGGVWFESYVVASVPGVSSSFFMKQVTTFRQYIPLPAIQSLIAYRLSSQQKIAGSIPFYALATFYSSLENFDGPGGAFTLRGIRRNRIAADSYLLGNLEFRKSLFSFKLFNIDWHTEGVIFSDMIMITRDKEFSTDGIPEEYRTMLLREDKQKPHATMGAGFYLIYNANNIISVDFGYSPNPQLGSTGLYIGSAFLF